LQRRQKLLMHPRISELLAYVDRQTAVLKDAYESIPPEQRNVRANPGRWSPAEVVHHVALVERRLAQRLASLIEQARPLPPETETTSVLSPKATANVLDRTARFVTSEATEPRGTDPTRVWDELMDAHREVLSVIQSGDGLALGSVAAARPRLGEFNGYEWIAFIGSHAARHADQIREMSAAQ
jgi:transposase